MKILILSDIHGDLEVLSKIINNNLDVDLKIYLGDFQISRKKQKEISEKFDYVVQGNCDYPNISDIKKFINVGGVNLFITHGHYFTSFIRKVDFDNLFKEAESLGADLILHGHDHIAAKEKRKNIIRFNPGSTTYPRGGKPASYGILEIRDKKIILLEHIKI